MSAARYEAIIAALESAGVRYVIAGGFAVNLHGFLRFTKDLDLLIDLSAENASNAMSVLSGFGLKPRVPVALADFADPAKRQDWFENRNMLVFQVWHPEDPFCSVDVFIRNPIAFDDVWARSKRASLGSTTCRIASIEDLIAMKVAVKDDLACDYREAELNHLRDALAMTPAQRWQWLREAMDFGYQLARSRAADGLLTLGPQGEVLWSAAQEVQWQAQHPAHGDSP